MRKKLIVVSMLLIVFSMLSIGIASSPDVAVLSVTPSTDITYVGLKVNITVVVKNLGDANATFNVDVYYDANLIGTQKVEELPPSSNSTLTFSWNTIGVEPCHNYTITANATLPGDIDLSNNVLPDGKVKMKMVGDVDGNGAVNMDDIYKLILAFLRDKDDPEWDPNLDMDGNGITNMKDIFLTIINFGSCP